MAGMLCRQWLTGQRRGYCSFAALDLGLLQEGEVSRSLDLLDVDFLSVPAVIGVARDMALSITGKCHAP
jgi:hypothetical protein